MNKNGAVMLAYRAANFPVMAQNAAMKIKLSKVTPADCSALVPRMMKVAARIAATPMAIAGTHDSG